MARELDVQPHACLIIVHASDYPERNQTVVDKAAKFLAETAKGELQPTGKVAAWVLVGNKDSWCEV